MVDSIAFGIALLILLGWIAAWSLLGLIVASSLSVSMAFGAMAGALFGPLGILFVGLGRKGPLIPRAAGGLSIAKLDQIAREPIRDPSVRDDEMFR
jgi:hypothetical protein